MSDVPPERASSGEPEARTSWRERWRRWPVKLGAAVGAAFIAWAVSFIGPKIWNTTTHTVAGDKPPLSIVVITDVARFTSGADGSDGVPLFVFSGPLARLGVPPDGGDVERAEERWAWAHKLGAVDANTSLVRVKVSGTTPTPVILDNLRITVTKRRPPLAGWVLGYLGLGSGQGVRYFEVNLDKPSPTPEFVGRRDPLPLRVSDTDVEVIDLLVSTLKCDCEWEAKLDWAAGDKQGTTTITDHGKPFRTAAPVRAAPAAGEPIGDPKRVIYWQDGRWMINADG